MKEIVPSTPIQLNSQSKQHQKAINGRNRESNILFNPLMLMALGLAGIVTESEAGEQVSVDALRALEEALVRKGMTVEQAYAMVEQALTAGSEAGRQQALANLSAIIDSTVAAAGGSAEAITVVVDAIAAEIEANPLKLDLLSSDTLHAILDRTGLFSGQNVDGLIAQIQSNAQSIYGELLRPEVDGVSVTDAIAEGVAGAGEAIGAAAAVGGEMVAAMLGVAAVAGGGGGGGATSAVASLSGTVVKGPVSGATVFRDMPDGDGNYNYQWDEGEYKSEPTGEDGSFTLLGSGGRIVATGGIDTFSGNPLEGTLSAPVGATVVTPLTTLLANSDLDASKLATSLGLTVDLLSYVPASMDDPAEAAARSVQNLLVDLAEAISSQSDGGVNLATAVAFVAGKLAQIVDSADGAVDLADATTVGSVASAVQTAAALGVGDSATVVELPDSLVTSLTNNIVLNNDAIKNGTILVKLQNDTGIAGDKQTTDGALNVDGAASDSTLHYSIDGTNWTEMSGDSLVFIPESNTITLTLAGNTPAAGTPFTVSLDLPISATEGGSGLTLAVPANTSVSPTATLDGNAVDPGITVTNDSLDELLLVENSGATLPSVTLKLASLLSQIGESNALFNSAQGALLGSTGSYTVTLTSSDFGIVYGGEAVRTIVLELSTSEDGYDTENSTDALTSEGIQLVDYDAEGDAQATTLTTSYNVLTNTLTVSGATLNLENLSALTDGDAGTTGLQPVLNFWLNDLPLIGNTDGTATSVQIRETPTSGDPVTKSFSFTLDYTAPAAPTVTLSNDTGSNSNDQITSDASLTPYGEDGAIFQYSADGSTGWSSTAPTATEGSNTVYVRQMDGAGNFSAATAFTFTLDTKTTTIDTTGSAISDGYLNATEDDSSLVITGSTTSAAEGSVVTITLDGTTYTGSTDADGDYSITIPASALQGLASGEESITAIVAGQVATPAATTSFIYDKTAPEVTITGASVLSESDNYVNAAESAAGFTITGTSTFSNGQAVTITFSDGTNAQTATGTVTDGAFSVDVAADLLSGFGSSVTAIASVSDAAGNIGTSDTTTSSLNFTYDVDAPAAPTLSMNSSGDVTLSGVEANATVAYTLDGAAGSDDTSDNAITISTSGNYALSVTQTDAAGNTGAAATATAIIGDDNANIIIPSATAELIKLGGGNDEISLSDGDFIADFQSGDQINLTTLLGKNTTVGYESESNISLGSSSAVFQFENMQLTNGVASADFVYRPTDVNTTFSGGSVTAYLTAAASDVASVTMTNKDSDWANTTSVSYSSSLGRATLSASAFTTKETLANGESLGTFEFTLEEGVTSFLFQASYLKVNGDEQGALPATQSASGGSLVSNAQFSASFSDSIGTIGDNEIQIARSYDSASDTTTVQLKYDSDSAADSVTASDTITTTFAGDVTALIDADSVIFPGEDVTAPTVAITATGGADSIVSSADGDAVIRGTTNEPGTDVTIKFGSEVLGTATPDALGDWSYTLTQANWTTIGQSSATGDKTVIATQTDASDNTSVDATDDFTLDTVAPNAATITAVGSDTTKTAAEATASAGIISVTLDNANDTATVTFTGTSGTVTKTVTGSTDPQLVTLDESTDSDLTTLGDGAVTVSTVVTDAAGNAVAADTTGGFTLDTTAPAALTIALTEDTGSASDDQTTSNGAVTVTGAETGATVKYSINAGVDWTSNFTAIEGANSVLVRQTDVAGNFSSTTSLSFTLDTSAAAPTIALTSDTGTADDAVSSNGALTLSGTETGATVEYSSDGESWASSFTAAEGDNSVQVRQTDVAGNVSDASSAFAFTLDTTVAAPAVALTSDAGSSATDNITNDGALSVTGTETGATVQYSSDGESWSTTAPATAGANMVMVRQIDTAGNVSDATTARFVVDTTAPASATITSADVVITQTPIVTGTAEIGSTVTLTIGGATYSTTATDGSWSVDLSSATPASGTLTAANSYSASVAVTDVAGNAAASAADQNITVNADVPTVTSAVLSTTAAPTVTGTAVASTAETTNVVTVTVGGATYTINVAEDDDTDGRADWSLDLSSATPSSGTLSLTVDGSAANAMTVAASNVVGVTVTQQLLIDSTAPTVAIALSDNALLVDETSDVTITFSEAVTGFVSGDITAENGTISELRTLDDGTTWTALLTPTASTDYDASNTISIAAESYTDSFGNNGGAGSATYSVDTTTPTLETISSTITSFARGDVATLTFDFSEAPVGFELADITGESNGTVSDLRVDGSDSTIYYANYTPDNDVASLSEAITVAGSAFADVAGNSGAVTATTLSLTGDTRELESGTAQDGYIAGATVFRDTNGNGVLDTGEDSTTTDESGNFLLAAGTGDIVLTGGTDISTGHAFTGVLKAPEGSTVVNTLTTLVSELIAADTGGGDAATKLANAQTAMQTAFGIPASVDLTTYDPIQAAAANSEDTDALNVAKTMAQVNVIVNTISKTVAAAVGTSDADESASESIFESLASTISSQGASTDLTDATTLQTLTNTAVTEAATDAGLDSTAAATAASKVSAVVAEVATVVSASVSKVAEQTDLNGMVKATGAATGTVASKLESAIENDVELVASEITAKLDDYVAAVEVGTIVPPTVTLNAIATDGSLTATEAASDLTISGTATGLNGETVTLMVGADTYFATVSSGTFSVTVPTADLQDLNEGTVRVTADAEDSNGVAATTARSTLLVDTTAPAITSAATATAIDENSGAGQTVYTATTDTTATFTISGTDAAVFSINASTGAVTLTGDPDYETQSSYSFTVVAADSLGNSSQQVVSLSINDIVSEDTAAPVFTSGATATVVENSGAGQTVYTAAATDASAVIYTLSGTDAAAFSIDSSSGAVTLTADPNYEWQASYSFTVTATDAYTNTTDQAVTLAITNQSEAPVLSQDADGIHFTNLETGGTWAYSTDGGDTWTAGSNTAGDTVVSSVTSSVNLQIAGNTPGGTAFTLSMTVPVVLDAATGQLTVSLPADGTITPQATLDGSAVDLGVTLTNSEVDQIVMMADSSSSTPSISLKIDSLLAKLGTGNSTFNSAVDAILNNDGTYTVTLESEDLTFTMFDQTLDTVSFVVPVNDELDYPVTQTLISDGVQLVDYDANGDVSAALLQSSYNSSTQTLTYDLTNTGLGLNRDNLEAVLDPDIAGGTEPVLNFDLGTISGTSGRVNFELAGTTDGGSAFTVAFALDLDVSTSSGAYVITTAGGDIAPTATISGNAVNLNGFTLSNDDMDQFLVMGTGQSESPDLSLKLESLLSQLNGNAQIQSAAESLLSTNGSYTLTVSALDGTDGDSDPDLSFTMDGQTVTSVVVTLPVTDALDYPVAPALIDEGVQLVDYDASGDMNVALLQHSLSDVDSDGDSDLLFDLTNTGLGINRDNLSDLSDNDSGTTGSSPQLNIQMESVVATGADVMVRQTVDGMTSSVTTLSVELDPSKTDFVFS